LSLFQTSSLAYEMTYHTQDFYGPEADAFRAGFKATWSTIEAATGEDLRQTGEAVPAGSGLRTGVTDIYSGKTGFRGGG
jgi:hypothetical protein